MSVSIPVELEVFETLPSQRLAVVLREAGNIEATRRCPSVDSTLDLDAPTGLAELLAGLGPGRGR